MRGGTALKGVLVFGATSMVGSDFVSSTSHQVVAAGRNSPSESITSLDHFERVELADTQQVEDCVESNRVAACVNFAARTDVDGVERERPPHGAPASGPAWQINAVAAGAMARAAARKGMYFVQISTDFVFDGLGGPYAEDTLRSPLTDRLGWYGWTKSGAERFVEGAGGASAIVRIAYPYRPAVAGKLDFPHWVLNAYQRRALPPLYDDQWITPTWIPDVSHLIEVLLRSRRQGVFHVASPSRTTPYEFGCRLLEASGIDSASVSRSSILSSVSSGRAPRPIDGGLLCRRTAEMEFTPTDWKDGLAKLVAQEGSTR